MEYYRSFLLVLFSLAVAIHCSKSQCTNGVCEKVSLSLATDTKRNFALDGYVFETLSYISNWQQCFLRCLKNCQCLSFNFNEVNTTENCELNDANTKLAPEALEEREGVIYYELVRNYYDKNGVVHQTRTESTSGTKCCDSAPCQNGGTCRDVCDVSQRRFNCTCPPGFTGHRCQFPLRSCKDVMVTNRFLINGIYNIMDQYNNSFPVYCDFASEPNAAWTLIQSHSFQNNDAFKLKPFYLHDMPINQDAPEWNNYRLSMSRMKSIQDVSTHWRATCNFPTDGVDYRDYIRVSLESLELMVKPDQTPFCLLTELTNVRGMECVKCTVFGVYGSQHEITFHIDSNAGPASGCDFGGGIYDEDNFGYHGTYSVDFRCTSSMNSTTQFWLGSF